MKTSRDASNDQNAETPYRLLAKYWPYSWNRAPEICKFEYKGSYFLTYGIQRVFAACNLNQWYESKLECIAVHIEAIGSGSLQIWISGVSLHCTNAWLSIVL